MVMDVSTEVDIDTDDDEQFEPSVAELALAAKQAVQNGDYAQVHALRTRIFELDPTFKSRKFLLKTLILSGDLSEAVDFLFETVESLELTADDLPYLRSLAGKLSMKIKQAVENKTLRKKDGKKYTEWLSFIYTRLNLHKAALVGDRATKIQNEIQMALESDRVPGPHEHIRAAGYLKVDSLEESSLKGVDTAELKKALQHFMIDNQMHAAYTLATFIAARDPASSLARYVVAKYLLQAGDSHFALVTIVGAKKMHAVSSDASVPNLLERMDEFIGTMLFGQFPVLANLLHKIACTKTYAAASKTLANKCLTQTGRPVYRVELAYELKQSGNFEDALLVRSVLLQHAQLILEVDPENEPAKRDVDICTKEIAEIREKLS